MLGQSINLNKDLNAAERFILYHVANLFLSSDYEKCRKVCSTNFSYIANNNLFESNILRFKALALEKLYLQHFKKQQDDVDISIDQIEEISHEKRVELLLDTIEAVQNSISISNLDYESDLILPGIEKIVYGTALAEFQLGCLYEKHVDVLTSEFPSEDEVFKTRFAQHHISDKETCYEKAKESFDISFECFKKLNHLKGMYLTQKHKLAVYNVKYEQYRGLIKKQMEEHREKFHKYV